MVLDMTVADDFALLENQREFIERYRAAEESGNKNKSLPMLASSCPGKQKNLYRNSHARNKNAIINWRNWHSEGQL